jgi:drug/metabolite transporter (DMT)-like permease
MDPAVRERLKVRGLFGLMTFCWGLGYVVVRLGSRLGVPPFYGAGVRFLIAAVLAAVLCAGLGIRIPAGRRDLERYLVIGLTAYALPFGLGYTALQYVDAGLVALVNATTPLWVAPLARLFLREPVTPRTLGGIGLGLCGLAVIYADSLRLAEPKAPLGVVLVLLACVSYAVLAVYVRGRCRDTNAVALNVPAMGLGGVLLTGCSVLFERPWPVVSVAGWATIVWLAVASSVVAFSIYYWLLGRLAATRVTMTSFLIPVVTLAFGRLMLGEHLAPRMLAGGVLVLLGVVIVLTQREVVSAVAAEPVPT